MKKLHTLLAIGCLSLSIAACSDSNVEVLPLEDGVHSPSQANDGIDDLALENIIGTTLAAGNFNTLAAALEATDLISVLGDETRDFTVFAPTDEAFAKLGVDTINALLADPDTLRDILLYHVLADTSVDAASAISLTGSTVTTANGDNIALSLNGDDLFINMSKVTVTDIVTSNGIIHVIDTVLTPPADVDAQGLVSIVDTLRATGEYNFLLDILEFSGLDTLLGNVDNTYTLLAPTDEAFGKLGEDAIIGFVLRFQFTQRTLLYHVIDGERVDSTKLISLAGTSVPTVNGASVAISTAGGQLLINDATVVAADIQAANGVIHSIDTVLDFESAIPAINQPSDAEIEAGTLLDIAKAAGNFTTLVAALEATGLDGAIGHSGDLYTVFAPTDEAFAALGQETIDALLSDPETLRDILLYHVVPGTVIDANSAIGLVGTSIQAGNGDRFELRLEGESLFINDSLVTATDIRGVNGIIHVIDRVLTPPM